MKNNLLQLLSDRELITKENYKEVKELSLNKKL